MVTPATLKIARATQRQLSTLPPFEPDYFPMKLAELSEQREAAKMVNAETTRSARA
jgi:hypothetical protein